MTTWTLTALAQESAARQLIDPTEMLGHLPVMLWESDPRGAVAQFNEHYSYGGGWSDFPGFTIEYSDPAAPTLTYAGDPPMRCIAMTVWRGERIFLFEASWVAVVQPDGTMNVARMD